MAHLAVTQGPFSTPGGTRPACLGLAQKTTAPCPTPHAQQGGEKRRSGQRTAPAPSREPRGNRGLARLDFEKKVESRSVAWTAACQAPPSMGFSKQDTGVGCHFLPQEIFPTWRLNLGLWHCRQTLYCLSHQRPRASAFGLC